MEKQLSAKSYSREALTVALNIFNFPQDYKNRPRLRIAAFRYLFLYRDREPRLTPMSSVIIKQATSLFEENLKRSGDISFSREIADIINTHYPRHGQVLLEKLRNVEQYNSVLNTNVLVQQRNVINDAPFVRERRVNQLPNRPPVDVKKKIRTVYEDTQNVHNSKINQSVLLSAFTLVQKYKDLLELDKDHDIIVEIGRILRNDKVEKAIDYVLTSTATFSYEKNVFSIQDVFKAVWLWINEQKETGELKSRLVEELRDAGGMCTTGHLARLINVIQGFSTEKQLIITIDHADQHKSVIKHYISKKLSECQDLDVIDGIMTGSDSYKKFLQKIVREKILEWIKEYGDEILESVPGTVNQFAQTTVF